MNPVAGFCSRKISESTELRERITSIQALYFGRLAKRHSRLGWRTAPLKMEVYEIYDASTEQLQAELQRLREVLGGQRVEQEG